MDLPPVLLVTCLLALVTVIINSHLISAQSRNVKMMSNNTTQNFQAQNFSFSLTIYIIHIYLDCMTAV